MTALEHATKHNHDRLVKILQEYSDRDERDREDDDRPDSGDEPRPRHPSAR